MPKNSDRRSLLKQSMDTEKDAVARRFEVAEKLIQERPEGLLSSASSEQQTAVAPTVYPPAAEDAHLKTDFANTNRSTVVQISLDHLEDNPYNARQVYSQEVVKDRAASIAKNGQLTAATVATDPERPGFYFLIDGHYRKRALRLLERQKMDCVIREIKTKLDLYRLSFVLNEERDAQSVVDNALAWRKLLDEDQIAKEEDLCDLTTLSWATVNKTLALLKLPKSVIERICENPSKFGLALGYELTLYCKQCGETETLELINRILEEDLSSREVIRYRKLAEDGVTRKPREISRQYKIRRDGVTVGFIKDWDSGKLVFEVKGLAPKEREELIETLRSKFKMSGELDAK